MGQYTSHTVLVRGGGGLWEFGAQYNQTKRGCGVKKKVWRKIDKTNSTQSVSLLTVEADLVSDYFYGFPDDMVMVFWECLLGLLCVKHSGMFCHSGGLDHWFYSLVSLMYSHTLIEMASFADIHPFAGAEILLVLWFLLGVAQRSLVSER
jgi:hypothetical protein